MNKPVTEDARVLTNVKGLPTVLRNFVGVSLILWTSSVIYVLRYLLLGRGIVPRYIFSRPFTDLNFPIAMLMFRHDSDFFTGTAGWTYPVPMVLLFRLFAMSNHFFWKSSYYKTADFLFIVAMLLTLTIACRAMSRELTRRGLKRRSMIYLLTSALLTSWPLFMGARQGNTETLLWFGVALGIWLFYRGQYRTSALTIGFIGSFKLYPMLLLLLFLRPLRWKHLLLAVITFLAMNTASLLYLGPTLQIAASRSVGGVQRFARDASFVPYTNPAFAGSEHDLIELLRALSTQPALWLVHMSHWYSAVALTVFIFVFVWRVCRMPFINQVLYILLFTVTLLPKSYDYTLLMLYVPWALLAMVAVSSQGQRQGVCGLMAALLGLAFVLAPELFLHARGYFVAGQYKTIVLLALIGVALTCPFQDEAELLKQQA